MQKVLLKRFHLNGHIIGFCRQTKKLDDTKMSPLVVLTFREWGKRNREITEFWEKFHCMTCFC